MSGYFLKATLANMLAGKAKDGSSLPKILRRTHKEPWKSIVKLRSVHRTKNHRPKVLNQYINLILNKINGKIGVRRGGVKSPELFTLLQYLQEINRI